ncbi:unnamed protein product [Brachionus calyciflorus]|uniref:TMEM248/TMEM219 domain-containing protein n=1 Tax=Brachionus calyciflorus TaxID=104777 RepID=A0A813M4K0_9BILA|nr:unnamed protein product [Brachionus calyciflorus]
MRRFSFGENLKHFIKTNPPGVVFLVCILTFIIILSSYMDYINRNQIRNPDELDWNAFRRKMAELDYCFKFPTKPNIDENSENKSPIDYFIIDKSKKSYSYPVVFNMHFDGNKSELEKLDFFSTKIKGFLIGLEKEEFDVNFQVSETSLLYDDECTKNILLGKQCYKYTINGCLTFSGFSKLFKKTKSPNLCQKSFRDSEILDEKSSSFVAYKETPEFSDQYWCPSNFGAKAKINYKVDPKLIPFLNKVDKELITSNLKICIYGLCISFTCVILVILFKKVRKNNSDSMRENFL